MKQDIFKLDAVFRISR